MKLQKQSAIQKVGSFIAGTSRNGKPAPSTLTIMLEARKLRRQTRDLKASMAGKPKRGAMASIFVNTWDTLMAYVITILLIALRIALFLFLWVILLMALPAILRFL